MIVKWTSFRVEKKSELEKTSFMDGPYVSSSSGRILVVIMNDGTFLLLYPIHYTKKNHLKYTPWPRDLSRFIPEFWEWKIFGNSIFPKIMGVWFSGIWYSRADLEKISKKFRYFSFQDFWILSTDTGLWQCSIYAK